MDAYGYDEEWSVCFTTDGASNVRSARAVGRHTNIGLTLIYGGDCFDHQFHLLVEESINNLSSLRDVLIKVREFVTYIKQSWLAKQELINIQIEYCPSDKHLAPVMGTLNRWYHKYLEVSRMIQLKNVVQIYDEQSAENNKFSISSLDD